MADTKHLSLGADQALRRARGIAKRHQKERVDPVHLLLGILEEVETPTDTSQTEAELLQEVLIRCGVSRPAIRAYAEAFLDVEMPRKVGLCRIFGIFPVRVWESKPPAPKPQPPLSASGTRVLQLAHLEARREKSPSIRLEHLFLALLHRHEGPHLVQVLEPLGLTLHSASTHYQNLRRAAQSRHTGSPLEQLSIGGERALNTAYTAMRASYCGRISTLHLLLGALADEENVAVFALRECGVELENLRTKARRAVTQDGQLATPQRKFTPGAKRALERAREEAARVGHRYIGAEHLLLGLLPRPDSWHERVIFQGNVEDGAAEVLAFLDAARVRREIYRALGVEHPTAFPSPKKHFTRANVTAFLLALGWNVGVPLIASTQSKQLGEDILKSNCLLLGASALMVLTFHSADRTDLEALWYYLFGGFVLGIAVAWLLLSFG